MEPTIILNSKQFELTIKRLCYQLIENHGDFSNAVIIGLQPRGVFLANRLKDELMNLAQIDVQVGALDITFFRDDFRRTAQPKIPSVTNLDFSIENKNVIIVDDVLFTGRTVRAGMEACLTYGRPVAFEFMAFIDRRFQRNMPIQPNYIGKTVDTIDQEYVKVQWKENEESDCVLLYKKNEEVK